MDGEKTEFIWQGNRLIAESRQNDKVWQSYIYEPDSFRPLALVEGHAKKATKTRTFWYQNDQLGSPIKLTDSLGDTVYECEYNAYGQLTEEHWPLADNHIKPTNPLRLQGQYFDEESGLHYNLNRYYDPGTGRYITQDPLGIAGGLNPYQYCQNPVNWIDPLGLFNVSRNGFEGVVGTRSNEIISETLEGMNRPVRQPNTSFPPNQTMSDALKSDKFKKMAKLESLDCSEIADKLLDIAGGKGKIIEVRPLKKGMLNVFENGHIEGGQYYHQVYTDGKYIYDPRLSSNPIPKGDWEKHIKAINTEGIIISKKLYGL